MAITFVKIIRYVQSEPEPVAKPPVELRVNDGLSMGRLMQKLDEFERLADEISKMKVGACDDPS